MIGYDTEYTKREMSLFTRVVLLLLIFVMVLFLALFVGHFKFGLNANMIKIFWQNYLTFARWLITAYSVTWIGQMGKAFLAKREEERNKLQSHMIIEDDVIINEEEDVE